MCNVLKTLEALQFPTSQGGYQNSSGSWRPLTARSPSGESLCLLLALEEVIAYTDHSIVRTSSIDKDYLQVSWSGALFIQCRLHSTQMRL